MKQITPAWIDKAEADFEASKLLRRSRKKYARDVVCFHLQQCVEKYLKARLIEAGISFPKTHDLEELLDLSLSNEPLWESFRSGLAALTSCAVRSRYPGRSVAAAELREFVALTKRVRATIRTSLGLK